MQPGKGTSVGRLLAELWRARQLVVEMVLRELRARYRASLLGYLWTLLNPLAQLAVYSLVFAVVARAPIEHYPVFLLAGLLPWLWFAEALSSSATTIVRHGRMVTHSTLPPQALPAVEVLTALANGALALPVLAAAAAAVGRPPSLALLYLPLVLVAQLALMLGLSLAVAALTVLYRDVQFLAANALSLWLFLTPGILYDQAMVQAALRKAGLPPGYDELSLANPICGLVRCYSAMFYRCQPPTPVELGAALAWGALALLVGLRVAARYRYRLAEVL